jgi:hypothetical protein
MIGWPATGCPLEKKKIPLYRGIGKRKKNLLWLLNVIVRKGCLSKNYKIFLKYLLHFIF